MENLSAIEFRTVAPNSPSSDRFFNIPLNNIDIGRESMPIIDLSTSFGRESLGILKLDCNTSSQQNFRFSNLSQSSINVLDQAFILSPSRTDSLSTYSMQSSNFSFNINDFDQPSVIKTSDSFNSLQFVATSNNLNNAFWKSSIWSDLKLSEFRSRFYSFPMCTSNNTESGAAQVQQKVNRVSEGCQKISSSLQRPNEIEDTFNDSVFIEAHHLTFKLSGEGSNDGFILDETDPPELFNGELGESKCENKCDRDVFKKIDTLLPVEAYQKLHEKLDNHPIEHKEQLPNFGSEFLDSCNRDFSTEEEKEQFVPEKYIESTMEKSELILHTLSQILNKDDLSERETEQGQTLLNILADMLVQSRERSKSFAENSGVISIGHEPVHSSSSKSENTSLQTNHSTSTKISTMPRRYSNSFTHPTKALRSKLATSSGKSCFDSVRKNSVSISSEPTGEFRNSSMYDTNLKKKRAGPAQARRGPMKAITPLEKTETKKPDTATKEQTKLSRLSSRISTPIREVQLRPVAQSTPDKKTFDGSMEQPNVRSFRPVNVQHEINGLLHIEVDQMKKQQSQIYWE